MKKLFSAVLALCTSLLFGLLLTSCSYFDFAGGGTVVTKETVYETVYVESPVEVPVEVPVNVLTACSCWKNSDGVLNGDEMLSDDHYAIEVLQEHFAKADGTVVNGAYLIKCKKCTWSCRYEGALHRNFKTVVEGDCKNGAFKRVRCKDCNIIQEETATTVEHTYSTTPTSTTAATCVAQGSKIYKCTVCGKGEKTESTPIAPDNHKFSTTASSSTPATCTKAGTLTYKCTNKGCTKTKTVDNPNAPATHASAKVTYAAEVGSVFCTDGGYEVKTCTKCNETISKTFVKAPGHTILMEKVENDPTITEDMIGWTLTKAPSDTEKGTLTGFCMECRETVESPLPAWDFKNYSYVYNCKTSVITYTIFVDTNGKTYAEKPANTVVKELVFVNENATTYHTLHNELMTETRYLATLKGVTELSEQHATCATDGYGYFNCEACKEPVYIATYLEHSFEGAEVIPYEGKEATCAQPGEGYSVCLTCRNARKENIPIVVSHSYTKAYEPVVTYNPETNKWVTELRIPCANCDHFEKGTSSAITITASKAPTCTTSGYATFTYKDYDNSTVTKTVIVYAKTDTTPEGFGHDENTPDTWTWVDEQGNTHEYTGYVCKHCGTRFIKKEVIKDKNGNLLDTIEYPIAEEENP